MQCMDIERRGLLLSFVLLSLVWLISVIIIVIISLTIRGEVDGSSWKWDKWYDHGGGNKEPTIIYYVYIYIYIYI